MKRLIPALFLILSLFAILTVTVSAGGGEIVTNPQNYRWPEYSTAIYEAKAMNAGGAYVKDADIHWFLVYQGTTYPVDKPTGKEPWYKYVNKSYGAIGKVGSSLHLPYILSGLDGAEVFFRAAESGGGTMESKHAVIMIGKPDMHYPPQITVPDTIIVEKGTESALICKTEVRGTGSSKLTYIWYDSFSGKLMDIKALNMGSEQKSSLIIDSSALGHQYLVCGVFDGEGTDFENISYSSVIDVLVVENEGGPGPGSVTPTVTYNQTNVSLPKGGQVTLTAEAKVPADTPKGTFTYQWYYGENNYPGTFTKAEGANTKTIILKGTDDKGTYYYFCEATYKITATGETFSSFTDDIQLVKVTCTKAASTAAPKTPVFKFTPVSRRHPINTASFWDDVLAESTDGATVHYKWYQGTSSDKSKMKAIPDSDRAVNIPDQVVGTTYYYVEAWAELNGKKSTSIYTDVWYVEMYDQNAQKDTTPVTTKAPETTAPVVPEPPKPETTVIPEDTTIEGEVTVDPDTASVDSTDVPEDTGEIDETTGEETDEKGNTPFAGLPINLTTLLIIMISVLGVAVIAGLVVVILKSRK